MNHSLGGLILDEERASCQGTLRRGGGGEELSCFINCIF